MGLIGANAPKDLAKKCFSNPISTVPEIENSSIKVDHVTLTDAETHIQSTLKGTKTIYSSQSDEYTAALLAYTEGSSIEVTWFHDINSEETKRTFQTDWAPTLNSVHYSFQKINNFQFKLKGSFTFSYDQQTAKSDLVGEGVLYPYFCPYQSDMFVYTIEDNVYGLYKLVEAPIRLSIKNVTCHQIKFSLLRYLTKEEYDKLLECVDDEVYFNLDNYLNTEGGFLTSDETVAGADAATTISTLINYYNSEFYDEEIFRSYIECPCLYDPYVVEFWTKIVPIDQMIGFPTQLVSNPRNWKRSFWYHLLYPEILPKESIIGKAWRVLKLINYRTINVNALSNHCFISISKYGKHQYPPFNIPSAFDEKVQTVPMELKLYIDKGKVRPPVLLALSNNIYNASRSAQFYYIPILVFLLKRLIAGIEAGEDIVLGNIVDEDCSGDCTNCILNCTDCQKPYHHLTPCETGCNCVNNCRTCDKSCELLIPPKGGTIGDPSIYRDIEHDIDDGCEEYTEEE